MSDVKSKRETEFEKLVIKLSLEVQTLQHDRKLMRDCLQQWNDLIIDRDTQLTLPQLQDLIRNISREMHAIWITTV
jgi:hypothetical protein